jgi:cation/acetate symporter
MPLAFLSIWIFSVTDRSARAEKERQAFDAQFVQSETGIGGFETKPNLVRNAA